MCEYIKRTSPQDTPTDDIRLWSSLTHSVVEYTGPEPFGMDGSVCLWLHERSATQLLDMCDELDAKFSDLKSENAKLRELVKHYANEVYEIGCLGCPYFDEYQDKCGPYKLYPYTDGCRLLDDMRELKIEVPHD